MRILDKIAVLNKNELPARFAYFVKKKTNYFQNKILNKKRINNRHIFKIDIFNSKNLSFSNDNVFCYANKHFGFEQSQFIDSTAPWYRLNLKDFPGDIREYWEYNRLQFLNPILSNYLLTNDKKYISYIDTFLEEWFRHNPLETGWNHVSNLEIAIRSLVLYRIWFYIGDELSIDLEHILYIYGLHIYYDLPRTNACVPNNHSLGESVAMFFLGTIFKMPKWIRLGKKTINKRFDLFTPNGEGKEESSGYLLFTTQMLVFLSSFSHEFDTKILHLLPNLFDNLKSYSDKSGTIVQFGDCDFGLYYCFDSMDRNSVSSLSLSHFCNYKELCSMYSVKTSEENTKRQYSISLTVGDVRVVMVGGYEINHAHNHCLSYFVWKNGKLVILNPGTFRYNDITREKRAYYAETKRQNSPLSFDRDNLVSTFRHKKIIKNIELIVDGNKIIGIATNGKSTIERTIYVTDKSIVVKDYSTDILKKHHVIMEKELIVRSVDGRTSIEKIVDLYSPCYGYETMTEYAKIVPDGLESTYSLHFE